jgi:hypothetical protein
LETRSQLTQTTADLHECKTQLHAALDTSSQLQSQLTTTAAAKAGLERRVGALKLLLAEQVSENAALVQGLGLCQEGLEAARQQLQQAEAQQAAARAEIASKVRVTSIVAVCLHDSSVSCKQWWCMQRLASCGKCVWLLGVAQSQNLTGKPPGGVHLHCLDPGLKWIIQCL